MECWPLTRVFGTQNLGFGTLNHGMLALNKGIWDPKPRVANVKGTNLKSLTSAQTSPLKPVKELSSPNP